MTERTPITWANGRRRLGDLIPWERNPRRIADAEAERLAESLILFGQIQAIAIGPHGEIYDGHQRQAVWSAIEDLGPDFEVDVRVASRPLSEEERQQLVVYLHRGTNADWDWGKLQQFDREDLLDWGFDEAELNVDRQEDAAPVDVSDGQAPEADERQSYTCPKCGFTFYV